MKNEQIIWWNVVNSFLSGLIAFLSSLVSFLSSRNISTEDVLISLGIAFTTSVLIGVYKFNDYWKTRGTCTPAKCMFNIL